MKSNVQLRRDDSDDEVPIPPAMPVGFPDMASSSQTVPPLEPEINFSQILEALASIQGGMSNMQQIITLCSRRCTPSPLFGQNHLYVKMLFYKGFRYLEEF
jgi:hypothetical protein